MHTSIRWAIAGTGTIANHFAADFEHVEGVELVACGSRQQSSGALFAQKWGIEKVYYEYEALLADPAIDIVYLAVPHHMHMDYSLRAIEAGKGVLCEKPLTLNASEARSIILAARKHRVFFMEAMWMRCLPLVRRTLEWIDAGKIGQVRHVHAEFGYPTVFEPNNRFYDLHQAGGSLLDRGIYPITLAYMLLGKPTEIRGDACIGETGVDESSCYQLVFSQGAQAELCSTLRHYASNSAIITGSEGWIKLHAPFYRPELISLHRGEPRLKPTSANCDSYRHGRIGQRLIRLADHLITRYGGTPHEYLKMPGYGYQYEIEEASRCLREGLQESPWVTLEDTEQTLNIMDELRQQWGLRYPNEQ